MKIELLEEDIPEFSNEMMILTQVFATFKCEMCIRDRINSDLSESETFKR